MEDEMVTYSNLDQLKLTAEDRRQRMIEEEKHLHAKRDAIKKVVSEATSQYEELKSKLNENETFTQLNNLERRWQHQEQNNFAMKEFIATKKAETDFRPTQKVVEYYCKSKGLEIAGYYQGNENFQDSSPDAVAYRVAEKVQENFSDTCLVIVDNQKISVECKEIGFQLYQHSDNKWKLKDKTSVFLEQGHGALGIASTLLQSKVYRHLVDFDNHLDDISQDWSNQLINEEIARCL
ncbi:ER membrane protein complex subunit 8-like isoform X1 [Limulus polyphemus]|uniref:ER membrane protein complex subunit 8-like isoform X1 n=1 Tax=Limulus polyphemus TaxID=6850 RepID=A0ABM1RV01_LIMPO|nr:ER membrane protein complex subunit 8-like isoform X1 [Limulus polyphemus]